MAAVQKVLEVLTEAIGTTRVLQIPPSPSPSLGVQEMPRMVEMMLEW